MYISWIFLLEKGIRDGKFWIYQPCINPPTSLSLSLSSKKSVYVNFTFLGTKRTMLGLSSVYFIVRIDAETGQDIVPKDRSKYSKDCVQKFNYLAHSDLPRGFCHSFLESHYHWTLGMTSAGVDLLCELHSNRLWSLSVRISTRSVWMPHVAHFPISHFSLIKSINDTKLLLYLNLHLCIAYPWKKRYARLGKHIKNLKNGPNDG